MAPGDDERGGAARAGDGILTTAVGLLLARLTGNKPCANHRLLAACARDQVERRDCGPLRLVQQRVHHRGPAHATLAGTAVSPPQLDEVLPPTDPPSRATEMARLGPDEPALP